MLTSMKNDLSERGCGKRKKGGCYLTVATGPDGAPFENFLVDPPIPVDLQKLSIGPRGVHLIERAGVWHVFDVVGRQHYPNVADFVEEARLMGISRRAELPDYSKLTPASRLILIHQRAYITNWDEMAAELCFAERYEEFRCPRSIANHRLEAPSGMEMCAGLWWHNVEEMEAETPNDCRIAGVRHLPAGIQYRGWRSADLLTEYQYAIFGSFPLGSIEVVEDPDDRTHEPKLERARRASLPVNLVES